MTPEPPNKTSLFPRFGSKYRYSGRTHYETKKMSVDRTPPKFERSLTGKRLANRSMDGKNEILDSLEIKIDKIFQF